MPSPDCPADPAASPDPTPAATTGAPLLRDPERRALLLLARGAIRHGLDNPTDLPVDLDRQPRALRAERACFVTLHLAQALRGCIGHLEARQPLVLDAVENARGAAFRDPRFPPVKDTELDALRIEISVLTPAQPIAFESEQQLIGALRPGVDGVILAEDDTAGVRKGTFLPSVWEQLPQPREFLRHLKRKAGLSPDYWSDDLRAWRYCTESFGE